MRTTKANKYRILFCWYSHLWFLPVLKAEPKEPKSKEMSCGTIMSLRDVHDGLFIGNGYMGGNVFGRIENEKDSTKSTFWLEDLMIITIMKRIITLKK